MTWCNSISLEEAFSAGLIDDGETWIQMLQNRNRTAHIDNEETAELILANIVQHYHGTLTALKQRMQAELQSRGLS